MSAVTVCSLAEHVQMWSIALPALALLCDLFAASGTGFRSRSFYATSWAVAPSLALAGGALGVLGASGWTSPALAALATAFSVAALAHRPSRATDRGMPGWIRRWRAGSTYLAPNTVTDPWRWRRVALMTAALVLQVVVVLVGW